MPLCSMSIFLCCCFISEFFQRSADDDDSGDEDVDEVVQLQITPTDLSKCESHNIVMYQYVTQTYCLLPCGTV